MHQNKSVLVVGYDDDSIGSIVVEPCVWDFVADCCDKNYKITHNGRRIVDVLPF